MFFAFTASLADTNIHKLDDLLTAAYAATCLARPTGTPPGTGLALPNRFSQIIIQADPGNGGNVFVGDSQLSSSNYGQELKSTSNPLQIISPTAALSISTLDMYLLASGATQKVNIICIGG
jgi:hypothetical protein